LSDHKIITVIEQLYQGKITNDKAPELLGCCRITLYRKLEKYREAGTGGLIHRSKFSLQIGGYLL
jgi:CRP-like cAMP-binding protein